MSDFSGLSTHGRVATSEDADWDQVRLGMNLAADLQPAAVALVASADDVAKVIGFARDNGLRVTAQTTGHGGAALPDLGQTILIKTQGMKAISIEAGTRTARVEAGVQAAELGAAAAEHGMTFLPGSSPTVGVTGYTLGGGLGWLARRHGLACNHVRAIEVVTADGEVRQLDSEANPDLYWALRGGGGGFAIVTALHLGLLELSEVYAGLLIFPAEVGAAGIRTFRDWAAEAPREVTSTCRFLTPPPLDTVPEPIRGKPLLVIGAAYLGSRSDGEKVIEPLRGIGEPIMDTFDQISPGGLSRVAMDPEDPVPAMGHHALVKELPDEAIDAFVGAAGVDSGSPLLLADLRQAGGALAETPQNAGALARLDCEFVLYGVGVVMDPGMAPAITEGLDRLVDAMKPWADEGGFFNFADRPCDVDALLPEAVCDRLASVKRSWDPDDLILANHSVALAPA
jgi:FAD binding domain